MTEGVCPLGLTHDEIEALLAHRVREFDRWIFGHTMGICDGTAKACSGAHGTVYYRVDVERFLCGSRGWGRA